MSHGDDNNIQIPIRLRPAPVVAEFRRGTVGMGVEDAGAAAGRD